MITIYRHRRNDTNEVFYIGIGNSTNRAYYKHGRNSHWKNIVNKVGYSVEIVCTCETWQEACQIEQYLIKYYGRRDLGTGTLVNMTKGGDGVVGRVVTEETLQKMSKVMKGRVLGKTSLVLDTQTGVFYNSIAEASLYYSIKKTTLWAMLTGQNPNKTNLITV